MADLDVSTNAAEVSGALRHIFHDQIPFAAASAVNATALQFQKRQRAHQREIFTVRRAAWVDRSVKVRRFAKKADPMAEVAIDPPGDRADIIAKFETETSKQPTRGRSRLSVPTRDVPQTGAGIVRNAFRPASLELQRIGTTKGGGILSRGKKRTFSVREPDGRGFIAQRVGRGSNSKLRTIFVFEPEVPLKPELDFIDNARDVVTRQFEANFAAAFDRAVRSAR